MSIIGDLDGALLTTQEQIDCFQRIIADHPESPRCEASHLNLGQLYLQQGNPREARRALWMLLTRFPATRMRATTLGLLHQMELIGTQPRPMDLRDVDGRSVRVPDPERPTLIEFWATWSVTSVRRQERLRSLRASYEPRRLQVLSVCLDGDPRRIKRLTVAGEMGWPQLISPEGWESAVAKEFRVISVPTTYLLDQHGIVRYVGLNGEGVARSIDELLNPRPAEANETK
jgi:hypothetical protein